MLRVKSKLPDSAMHGYDKSFNPAHFLFGVKCFLKDYNFGKGGLFIPAGNIINAACSAYNINQRMILATLQREMGLIECKTFDEANTITAGSHLNRLDWACGCGVPDDLRLATRYKGFENQINGACAIYRKWYDYYKPEMIKELVKPDKETQCIAENAITFSLLMYTPHVDALTLTERVYNRYFPA